MWNEPAFWGTDGSTSYYAGDFAATDANSTYQAHFQWQDIYLSNAAYYASGGTWIASQGTAGHLISGNEMYATECLSPPNCVDFGTDLACANGVATDVFGGPAGMVGCGGSVTFSKAYQLCGNGYQVCSSSEWNGSRGSVAPSADYWTADNLNYSGSYPNNCEAVLNGGTSCGTNRPMRVCTLNNGGTDTFGNACTWTGCGLGTTTDQYFGGCVADAYAGALCCQTTPGCYSGTPTDVFGGSEGMVGCGGQKVFTSAAQLCASGYHVCSSAEWNSNRGSVAPTADYWTSDNLKYSGSNHDCEALLSGGNSCGTNVPMRVCTLSNNGSDIFGNNCTWTGCGLGTTTNQYFGGCSADLYAGALCCQ